MDRLQCTSVRTIRIKAKECECHIVSGTTFICPRPLYYLDLDHTCLVPNTCRDTWQVPTYLIGIT